MNDTLARLFATIEARKSASADTSYTASLLQKGSAKCAEKFGEEAVEAIIAAAQSDPEALTSEAADVIYHLLVLLSASGVTLEAVEAELDRRDGISGHDEKASRSQ